MEIGRTPPGTSKKKGVPKSSTISASGRQSSAPPSLILNINDPESIIPDSHPPSSTGSEKSPRTSGRNRTPSIKQTETTNNSVITINKNLLPITPKKRKTSKDNDDDTSPTKKNRHKQERQPALESDTEIENNQDPIIQLIAKSMATAMHAQEQRFNVLAKQLQKQLHLNPDIDTSRSRSVSRSSSRSNSRFHHTSPKSNNQKDNPVIPIISGNAQFMIPPITQSPIQQTLFQFTNPSPFSNGTSLTPETLLRYWPWVDIAHLSAISHGTFDINNLPKLLRDEDVHISSLESRSCLGAHPGSGSRTCQK